MIHRLLIAPAMLALLFVSSTAQALEAEAAIAYVEATLDDVADLARNEGEEAAMRAGIRDIIERRGDMTALSKFVAGRAARSMSDEQMLRFQDVFANHLSRIYAERLVGASKIRGETASGSDFRSLIEVTRAIDAGRKGIVVVAEITPPSEAPVALDFLLSDRSGPIKIVDVSFEGVSMAITNREMIASVLDSHGGDIDGLIQDMSSW